MVAAFSPKPSSRSASAASVTTWLRVLRRSSSDRSKSRVPTFKPTTPGSRILSASFRSSSPVWSPCSTAIVVGIARMIWPRSFEPGPGFVRRLGQHRADVCRVARPADDQAGVAVDLDIAGVQPDAFPVHAGENDVAVADHQDSVGPDVLRARPSGVDGHGVAVPGDVQGQAPFDQELGGAVLQGVGLVVLLIHRGVLDDPTEPGAEAWLIPAGQRRTVWILGCKGGGRAGDGEGRCDGEHGENASEPQHVYPSSIAGWTLV